MLIRYSLLVTLLSISAAAGAASRALLVGVAPAAMFSGSTSSIDADVRKMTEVAQRIGVSASDITTLVHAGATRDAFVGALGQWASGSHDAQDTILIYFTGFGVPGASGSALASNTAGALVMSDSTAVWRDGQVSMERVVTVSDLAQALDPIPRAKVLLVTDTSRGAISLSAGAFQGASRFVALTSSGHDLGADARPEGTRFTAEVHRQVMAHPGAGAPLTPLTLAASVSGALRQGSETGAEIGGSVSLASAPLELVGAPTLAAPPVVAAEPQKFALSVAPDPADALVRIMNIVPKYSAGMLLEPGRYLVEISSPGYVTFSEWVELDSDPQTVTVTLSPAPPPDQAMPVLTAANSKPVEPDVDTREQAEARVAVLTRPEKVTGSPAPTVKDLSGKRLRDQVGGGQSGPRLAGVTGGCFEMGSPAGEKGRSPDERQHRVCVDSFWMGVSEVTVDEYRDFLNASGHRSAKSEVRGCKDPRAIGVDQLAAGGDINERPFSQTSGYRLAKQPAAEPVVCVTWGDAVAYAKWLAESTGHRYQLPTESQWEYAARAGGNDVYPWGSAIGKDNANCDGCRSGWGGASLMAAGKFPPNSWGFRDINGNVKEWTCSGYANYGNSATGCTAGGSSGSIVVRGGSWRDRPAELRSANRSAAAPGHKANTLGFRVVRLP